MRECVVRQARQEAEERARAAQEAARKAAEAEAARQQEADAEREAKATAFKEEGNDAFKVGRYADAVRFYTQVRSVVAVCVWRVHRRVGSAVCLEGRSRHT